MKRLTAFMQKNIVKRKTNNLHQNIVDTSKNKDLILKNCKKNVKFNFYLIQSVLMSNSSISPKIQLLTVNIV